MKNVNQIFSFSILKTFTGKILLTLLFFLTTQQLLAQIQDNFTDGDFSNDPKWLGDDSLFTISSGQLQLQAPAVSGTAYLATTSAAINNASWEFSVTLQFNPSGTNYVRLYLVSDQADLTGALNGYFILIGDTPDEISLYKQTGTTTVKIIDGPDGRVNLTLVNVKVKATRDASGNWALYSDVGITGALALEGTSHDSEHGACSYTGVFCRYSATRSDKIYFDDIAITGDPYIPPPSAALKDIIITEVFADPAPRVELPEAEYIELFNRSTTAFDLSGWVLTDGSSAASLSTTLAPGEYLIVTSSSAAASFALYGPALGTSTFPSLNNAGDVVMLKNAAGLMIDSIKFTDRWYRDDRKKEGGWSLELIDPNNPCGEEDNWAASEDDSGGTPGKQNSIRADKPDVTGPAIIAAIPRSETEISLFFNETLTDHLPDANVFNIQPAREIQSIRFTDFTLKEITIVLHSPLHSKVLYTITVQDVRDCAGNIIRESSNHIDFALPEKADSLDIVINEILFNPRPTGVDFVEVVNISDKFINLKNWSIANIHNGVVINTTPLTAQDLLFKPGAYLVFTENGNVLKGEYLQAREENFLEVITMPGFNDDQGSVALISDQDEVIDHFSYAADMHSSFINEEEGVSLERITFESSTDDLQNWKSASSLNGFATPGFINSNARAGSVSKESVRIDPEIFIPVSGKPDFTQIHYNFDQGGFIANVKIYDAQGRQVRALVNNALLGTEGFFRWEGDRDDGSKARVGYYMVWFEVFDDAGTVKTFRKRLAITATF
jgi:hypothetical protein